MLLLFALARPIHLRSLADANLTAIGEPDPSTSPCDNIDRCRTITDILWNCYSVVLLCTWLAVHPNVPSVHDSVTVVLMKYALITFMAIVAPELMILWALRQYVSCGKIANKYKRYGWKKCHAFLVLMGGLALYDGNRYICHLWDRESFDERIDPLDRQFRPNPARREMRIAIRILQKLGLQDMVQDSDKVEEQEQWEPSKVDAELVQELGRYSCLLEFLLARGYIDITEDDIKDKGHADVLSKTIAIFQTGWFILQCFARVAQGLDVAAIEVITFAFAVLNFVTYFLWWNKPLRVRNPVRVQWRRNPPEETDATEEVPAGRRGPGRMTLRDTLTILSRKLKEIKELVVRWFKAARLEYRAASDYIAEDYKKLSSEKIFFFLRIPVFAPIYPIAALYTRFRDLGVGCESDDLRYLFSSRLKQDPPRVYATVYMTAILFAVIHCVPWFFHFPTAIEQLLWRISAFFVTLAPIVFLCLHLSGIFILKPRVDRSQGVSLGILETVVITSFAVFWILLISSMIIFYVGARLALVILALTALRDLPPSGYEAVDWNEFLPHIG